MRIVIVGAGGHGRDVRSIAEAAGYAVLGFLDDDRPSMGPCSDLSDYEGYLLGVNDSQTRRKLDNYVSWAVNVAHPSASVHGSYTPTNGVVVGANTTIGPNVRLGRHTHVNGGCFITRADIGDFVTIGPGVTVCGDVAIGDDCMIGAGAVVSNLCELEAGVVLGAGAVVPPGRYLPAGTYVGVPARCCG